MTEVKRACAQWNQTFCLLFPQAVHASASIDLHGDKKKTNGYSSPFSPVAAALPRWGMDHGRHRLGVNRVPFIWLDAAGGPIRQPKCGWGRGRPMLSQPLKLTSSLGIRQTTVKLIKLPRKLCERHAKGRKWGPLLHEDTFRSWITFDFRVIYRILLRVC